MPWTKRDVVRQAYAEIGRADYDFDLQPEDLQYALRSLDSMMATWAGEGIAIGYAGGDGKGDIDADADVPTLAFEALYLNLALRLAPGLGKTPSQDTRIAAAAAKSTAVAASFSVAQVKMAGYAGAGSRVPNILRSTDDLARSSGSALELGKAG